MRRPITAVVAMVTLACCGFVGRGALAQLRTAPDINNSSNAQRGTGVNRLGIMTRPSPHRNTTNYVVPGGGYYYYGWSPGGYYFSDSYYDNYYGGTYLCPYCGRRWCNGACRYPAYYPPVVADAGALYGPRAMRQFLGVDNTAPANQPRAALAPPPAAPPTLSNPTARAQAYKFVEYGDRHFQRGDYRKAAERYRKAESQAADIPQVYFRQGFAELGAGQYAAAVLAIGKGLRLAPDWPDSGFVLEELYPSADAKRDVFRQLHTQLTDNPNDADARYLLAVLQHFDGQSAAAELNFRRVVELTGAALPVAYFLPPPEPQEEAEEPGPLLR